MAIDTTRVTGRRALRYETLDEFLAEAERFVGSQTQTLGNWSLGQIFRHLSLAINGSMDGFAFRLTPLEIWFARVFLKPRMFRHGFPAGFGFLGRGASVMPGETSVHEGLAELRSAIARFAKETKRAAHPAFGKLTADEWIQFHLRHAELHMSFVISKTK